MVLSQKGLLPIDVFWIFFKLDIVTTKLEYITDSLLILFLEGSCPDYVVFTLHLPAVKMQNCYQLSTLSS